MRWYELRRQWVRSSGSLTLLLRQCQRKAYVREKQTGRGPPSWDELGWEEDAL